MKELLTAKKLKTNLAWACIIMLAVMFVCALMGTEEISLRSLLAEPQAGTINTDYLIFVRVRIPRVILACVVGAALAASGVVFQALLRNPLADPYILGISSGAGLGAIVAVVSGLSWTLWGRSPIAVFAFTGALGTVWLVWLIGRFTAKSSVTGLLLAGVVINAFFSAIIMFLTSIAESEQVYSTIFWLMGNMTEEGYPVLWLGAGLVAAGVVALFYIAPQLNVISFGETQARTMGVNTFWIRTFAFAVAAAITAIAVSLSGLIGFVGLIIPHAVRLVFGPDHRKLIPLSAIIGGTFLVLADTLARIVVAPAQMPVGVITAIAGGPTFIILMIKYTRRIGWLSK